MTGRTSHFCIYSGCQICVLSLVHTCIFIKLYIYMYSRCTTVSLWMRIPQTNSLLDFCRKLWTSTPGSKCFYILWSVLNLQGVLQQRNEVIHKQYNLCTLFSIHIFFQWHKHVNEWYVAYIYIGWERGSFPMFC